MTLLNLVGVLLGKEQSGESKEEVDAIDVGMQIGKSVGTIPTDLLVGRTLGLLDGITRQLDPAWIPWRLSHIMPNAPS